MSSRMRSTAIFVTGSRLRIASARPSSHIEIDRLSAKGMGNHRLAVSQFFGHLCSDVDAHAVIVGGSGKGVNHELVENLMTRVNLQFAIYIFQFAIIPNTSRPVHPSGG